MLRNVILHIAQWPHSCKVVKFLRVRCGQLPNAGFHFLIQLVVLDFMKCMLDWAIGFYLVFSSVGDLQIHQPVVSILDQINLVELVWFPFTGPLSDEFQQIILQWDPQRSSIPVAQVFTFNLAGSWGVVGRINCLLAFDFSIKYHGAVIVCNSLCQNSNNYIK